MYFAYSWPRVLSTGTQGSQYILLQLDQSYFVAVSEWSVQVWSGGQVRLRLGQYMLSQQEVQQYGQHVAACWSPERSSLAVLTTQGWLLIYALHTTKKPVLPHSSGHWNGQDQLNALRLVDVYVKHTAHCEHTAPPTCLCCDSQSILVAFADGYMGSCSWAGKMRSDLFDVLPDALDSSHQQQYSEQEGYQQQQQQQEFMGEASGTHYLQDQQQQQHYQQYNGLPGCAIVHMHYSDACRLLAVVFADGGAALYTPSVEHGQLLTADLDFRRWLCGHEARATRVEIAPQAQLIALGTASGAVHLLRLHPAPATEGSVHDPVAAAAAAACFGSSTAPGALDAAAGSVTSPLAFRSSSTGNPSTSIAVERASTGTVTVHVGIPSTQLVRTLELHDWGHTPQQTGGVASLAWAPDCRALAVGFSRQGLVMWTPSGCRLLCTLRQPAADTPRANSKRPNEQPFGSSSGQSATAAASEGTSQPETPAAVGNGFGTPTTQGQQQQRNLHVAVDGAIDCLAWGAGGYQLMLASRRSGSSSGSSSSSSLYELSLAKNLLHHHRVSYVAPADGSTPALGVAQLGEELHVLQAADRLLLVTEALTSSGPGSSFAAAGMGNHDLSDNAASSGSDLHVHHVPLPASYLASNWPVQHVAVSACGGDIVAAGRQGLAVYNRRQEKWRLFGDISQERRVSCIGLGWLSSTIVACSCTSLSSADNTASAAAAAVASAAASAAATAAAVAAAAASGVDLSRGLGAGFKCQLLLFPRSHLDMSSLVASYTLSKVPLAMDCTEQHVLIASAPLQLLVLRLEGGAVTGGSGASSAAAGGGGQRRLVAVRELSMFNVGRPVQDVALVPLAAAELAKRLLKGADSFRPPSAGCSRISNSSSTGNGIAGSTPCYAVLLRWGGLMSVLDLSRGAELMLSDEIESFWLSDTLPVAAAGSSSRAGSTCASGTHSRSSSVQNIAALTGSEASGSAGAAAAAGSDGSSVSDAMKGLPAALHAALGTGSADSGVTGGAEGAGVPEVVEMPWWAYGPIGMQLWFPSLVLAAMQQPLHSSSSGQLRTQASLSAALSPQLTSSSSVTPLGGYTPVTAFSPRTSGLTPRGSAPAAALSAATTTATAAASSKKPPMSRQSSAFATATGAAAAAAAAGGIKHAQSAPMLLTDQQQLLLANNGAAVPAAAAAFVNGGNNSAASTEMELEFDREVYPIGVSLADASIVGVTQRVLRPNVGLQHQQQPSSPGRRHNSGMLSPDMQARRMSTASSTPTTAANAAAAAARGLPLPCFLPVPESQPVLPALLRRLLQQGALPEALALATRHEGGPHFRRSLEWLLFTTLDMEAGKCKPPAGKRGGSSSSSSGPHIVKGSVNGASMTAAAFAGVLGRQGKGWQGHPERHSLPVPVTPLLQAAVDLVLSFTPQCWDVVVSVSRKTDAALWPALFSAVGSPAALLELLLEVGALSSAACFLIVVDRLEGARLAQDYALSLMKTAMKRGQYFLCAEILRFLIPPRESSSGIVQWGPAAAAAAAPAATQHVKQQQQQQQQPPQQLQQQQQAPGSNGWFGWIWGGSNTSAARQQQQAASSPNSAPHAMQQASQYHQNGSGSLPAELCGRSSDSGAGGGLRSVFSPGADACQVVAEKGWMLLHQGKLCQLVQLAHSMAFLTGGLTSIMAAYRPAAGAGSTTTPLAAAAADHAAFGATAAADQAGAAVTAAAAAAAPPPDRKKSVTFSETAAAAAATAGAEDQLSVELLMTSLLTAVDELPVWESPEVEQDALMLLEVVRQLGVVRWCIALAVVLVDMSLIAPFAAEQPALWAEFCEQLQCQPELYFLHDVVGALAAPVGTQVVQPTDLLLEAEEEAGKAGEALGAAEGGRAGQPAQVLLLDGGLTLKPVRVEGGS